MERLSRFCSLHGSWLNGIPTPHYKIKRGYLHSKEDWFHLLHFHPSNLLLSSLVLSSSVLSNSLLDLPILINFLLRCRMGDTYHNFGVEFCFCMSFWDTHILQETRS